MASRASSLQLRTAPGGVTGVSAGNLWEVRCLIAGITSTLLGIYWDISWHMSIGRDAFFTPAHVAIYVGAILGGLGSRCSHPARHLREDPCGRGSPAAGIGARLGVPRAARRIRMCLGWHCHAEFRPV